MAAFRNGVVKIFRTFPRFPAFPLISQKRGAVIGHPVRDPPVEPREFEVSRNPEEWKFVSNLLREKTVPPVNQKEEYPSGWTPPNRDLAKGQPYFVERNKNHLLSLHLFQGDRGQLKVTVIKRIHGDIWQLHSDVKEYVQSKTGRKIASQVLEINSTVKLKGDHFHWAEEFLLSKGF